MTKETEPEQPEIPHKELQIQWHEDWVHSLKTGEPMREWECRPLNKKDSAWHICKPMWDENCEYRRKPRTVKYWHCVGVYTDNGGKQDTAYLISGDRKDLEGEILRYAKMCQAAAKFTPITETTAELED